MAEDLGVSKTTVSRALSGNGRVSEATRARVVQYAKEKNYVLYPTDSTSISKLPEAARNHLNICVKNSRKLLQQHNVRIKENKK